MKNKTEQVSKPASGKAKPELAAALRANLRRRKQAVKAETPARKDASA